MQSFLYSPFRSISVVQSNVEHFCTDFTSYKYFTILKRPLFRKLILIAGNIDVTYNHITFDPITLRSAKLFEIISTEMCLHFDTVISIFGIELILLKTFDIFKFGLQKKTQHNVQMFKCHFQRID